jgi:hypothetical protein
MTAPSPKKRDSNLFLQGEPDVQSHIIRRAKKGYCPSFLMLLRVLEASFLRKMPGHEMGGPWAIPIFGKEIAL